MKLIYTDGSDERFIYLCGELDDCLNLAVGGEKMREQYNRYNKLEGINDVVLIIEDDGAAACGSFKEYEAGTAEIKRVFTQEKYRNRGHAKTIMEALEAKAKEKGYTKLILETGMVLKAAIKLYCGMGFKITGNYGQYADMPESVCMEKNI